MTVPVNIHHTIADHEELRFVKRPSIVQIREAGRVDAGGKAKIQIQKFSFQKRTLDEIRLLGGETHLKRRLQAQ